MVSRENNQENVPVQHVKRPKDLFPGLNCQDAEGEALLALVQSKAMRQPDGNALVVLEALVVGPDGAIHHGEEQTLQGDHGVVHEDCVQGPLPLRLAGGNLLEVGLLARQSGDAEDEVELGELVVVPNLLRVDDKLLVCSQEGRLVQHREQGRPLLEVDVDASVGEQPRRYPHALRRRLRREGEAALRVQEGLGVKLGARLAALLDLALECLCRGCQQQRPKQGERGTNR